VGGAWGIVNEARWPVACFPKPIAGGVVLAGRGSMSPKTISPLAAFAMRQFGSHARNDNNATRGFRGFKGKGSNYVMPHLREEIDQLGSAATNPKRRLRRRTPKAVAFRGAPPNWRMPRRRLALWSAATSPDEIGATSPLSLARTQDADAQARAKAARASPLGA